MAAPDRDTRLHAPETDRLIGPVMRIIASWLGQAVHPVLLSVASLLAAAVAAALLFTDRAIAGAIAILAAAALDALAGWAPRRAGPAGAVLDGLADRYADTLMIGGVAALAHSKGNDVTALAAGGAALAACVVLAYAGARVRASAGDAAAAEVFGYTGRDVRLALLAVGVLAGAPLVALIAVAVFAVLPVVLALVRLRGLLTESQDA